jgi:hypothetical protein
MKSFERKIKKARPLINDAAFKHFISKIKIGDKVRIIWSQHMIESKIIAISPNCITSSYFSFLNQNNMWIENNTLHWGEEMGISLLCFEFLNI